MKVILAFTGITKLKSPRATVREAYSYGLIEDGEQWIDMMVDRNKTSHPYDEEEAKLIYEKVKNDYNHLLIQLGERMEKEISQIK